MGEIAEMMLTGVLCEMCGVYLEGEAPGYPRYCSAQCRKDRTPAPAPKVKCPTCSKKVKPTGLPNHMKDAHGNLTENEK